MKRITKKAVTYGHTVYRYVGAHQQHPEGDAPGMISISGIMDLLSRLARYEDTGLEPEEITALQKK